MKKKIAITLLAGILAFQTPVSVVGETVSENTVVEEAENVENADSDTSEEEEQIPPLTYHDIDAEPPEIANGGVDAQGLSAEQSVTLPAAYRSDQVDTNNDGVADTSYIPALRNQNPYGTCWAFSAIGACEAGLIKKGLAENTIDLSEKHLAYYFYLKNDLVGDLLNNVVGDYNRTSNNYLRVGGNTEFTMWQLASWAGPVSEDADSTYQYANIASDLENTAEDIYGNDAYHVQNIYRINTQDKTTMKQMIQTYGAVAFSYWAVTDESAALYDSGSAGKNTGDEGSYYCYDKSGTNHAVQIIGWDDNYSKDKFVHTPGTDGAWLVKNSWGRESTYMAQSGYFWISYQDLSIASTAYAFDCEASNNYENIYQYDGADCNGSGRYYQVGNVFTANAGTDGETLEAVSIGINDTTDYTVEIYKDVTDTDPTSGTKAYTQSGSFAYKGYHTIELDAPVTLTKGQKYSVVFTFPNSASVYYDQTYDNNDWISFYTAEQTAQSFGRLYSNSTSHWRDEGALECTLRIKAFTNNITDGNISKITLNKKRAKLKRNDTVWLQPTVTPSSQQNQVIIWTSGNESIATVDETGLVTAIGAGTTVITATTINGKKATCTIEVVIPTTRMALDVYKLNLKTGKSATLTAMPTPADTTDQVIWTSSDTSIATVSNGRVDAVAEGKTYISAKCGGLTAYCEVYVEKDYSLQSIALNKPTLELETGKEETLTVTYNPSNTTDNKSVTWSSDKEAIATVDTNGKVHAVEKERQ